MTEQTGGQMKLLIYSAIFVVIFSLALMAGGSNYFHQPDFSIADVDY